MFSEKIEKNLDQKKRSVGLCLPVGGKAAPRRFALIGCSGMFMRLPILLPVCQPASPVIGVLCCRGHIYRKLALLCLHQLARLVEGEKPLLRSDCISELEGSQRRIRVGRLVSARVGKLFLELQTKMIGFSRQTCSWAVFFFSSVCFFAQQLVAVSRGEVWLFVVLPSVFIVYL